MTNKALRRIVITGLTAAVYAVATMLLPIPAYGEFQCRVSEILNLLAFINPIFAPGIILGCFIANLASPFGIIDWFVGTFASAITMFFVTRSKSLFTASLWPTVFCVLIGAEIMIYSMFTDGHAFLIPTFLTTTLTIMGGEFVAMTLIGYPIFRYIMKNEKLVKMLKNL